MLNLIRKELQQIIENIDSGNSNISEQEQIELFNCLQKLNSKELSKTESAKYIGVSKSTFDNYINKGLLPKGVKRQGWNELIWYKSDLDKYLNQL